MKSSPPQSHSAESVWIPPGTLPPTLSVLPCRNPWPRPAHHSTSLISGTRINTSIHSASTPRWRKLEVSAVWERNTSPPLSPSCPNVSLWLHWRASSQQLHKHACALPHYPCIQTHADTNRSFAHSTQFGILASEHVLFYWLWHFCIINKPTEIWHFLSLSHALVLFRKLLRLRVYSYWADPSTRRPVTWVDGGN